MSQAQLKAMWPVARHWFACVLVGLLLALWPRYDSFHLWGDSYDLGFLMTMGNLQIIGPGPWEPANAWRVSGGSGILFAAVCWGLLLHFGIKARKRARSDTSWRGAAAQAVIATLLVSIVLVLAYWSFLMAQEWILDSNRPAIRERNYSLAVKWFPWIWMAAGLSAGLFVIWDARKLTNSLKVFHCLLALALVSIVTIVEQPRLNRAVDFFGVVADSAHVELKKTPTRSP
jgi:hypothetical protein